MFSGFSKYLVVKLHLKKITQTPFTLAHVNLKITTRREPDFQPAGFRYRSTFPFKTGGFGTIFRWLSEFVRNEQIITETKRKITQPPLLS